MSTTESIEDYMEAMTRLNEKKIKLSTTNIAKELGVSPASASEMLKKLNEKGYISYKPYKRIKLTKKGKALGKRILERHRLIERFLLKIGLSKNKIHEEAHKLEHTISNELEKLIKSEVDRDYKKGIISLIDLKPGQKGEIIAINVGFGAKKRLEEMGLLPGTKIKVTKNAPFGGPIEIFTRGFRLALGRGLAQRIFVKVES